MNKRQREIYDKQVKDVAHQKVLTAYHDAMAITDSVYLDILRAMREEIDQILANNPVR